MRRDGAEGGGVLSRILAIDPGEKHCGLAEFVERSDDWECVRVYELGPDECADRVASLLIGAQLNHLVIEEFRIYPDKALSLSYSEVRTAQLIGVLRYLHRIARMAQVDVDTGEIRQLGEQEVVCELRMQPAAIKAATVAILRKQGVESEAKRTRSGDHCFDAETHGWHYILTTLGMFERTRRAAK